MKDFNRFIKVKEKLANLYLPLCIINWACPPATMVAETSSIVAGGNQYHTNRLIKPIISLIVQLDVSFNRP